MRTIYVSSTMSWIRGANSKDPRALALSGGEITMLKLYEALWGQGTKREVIFGYQCEVPQDLEKIILLRITTNLNNPSITSNYRMA
jgi:hypothetical protein